MRAPALRVSIALLIAISGGAGAQSTRRLTINSAILAEQRTYDVSLPRQYTADSTKRFPLVVVLDGESQGEVATAIARYDGDVGTTPPVIVVAVHNTRRMRDFTPAAVSGFEPPPGTTGGAARFLSFLGDELLPSIDRSYRTAPMRVLIGHSLGGLFALHAIANRPALFTGYVVMEPAAWWNNMKPVADAQAALGRPEARRARVMLVNAPALSADTSGWGGDRPMVRNIRVADETHEGMAVTGISAALRRMFEDFRAPQWRPGTSPIDMLQRYDSLAARIGYQVDVPAAAYALVVRMCLDSRFFADADRALARMEAATGVSADTREFRARLAAERNQPAPSNFVPLVIPATRPSPVSAAKYLGKWQSVDGPWPHTVDIRASGDTIVVRDRIQFPQGEPMESDDPVIQIAADGGLEWGLRTFNGLAALDVLHAHLIDDNTLEVTHEDRGWVRRSSEPVARVVHFKRVASPPSAPRAPLRP